MKRVVIFLLTVLLIATVFSGCGNSGASLSGNSTNTGTQQKDSEQTTIQYWQYNYDSKVKLMTELIKDFEAKNPNITVKQYNYPQENYFQKLSAALAAASGSEGPNIINYHSAQAADYWKQGVVQPLPEDEFNPDTIDKEFSPLLQASKFEGKYYSIPLGVRTYALFYNKNILKDNGYTEEDLPKTWTKFAEMAAKITKWNGDTLVTAGATMDWNSRLGMWLEVMTNQLGGSYYSKDFKTATINSPECKEALEYIIHLYKDLKVGVCGFGGYDYQAFAAGKAAFHIDGSFRMGTYKTSIKDFEWGVMELPTNDEGIKSTFGDYWPNSITALTTGTKLDASVKFLKYLTTDDVMKRWTLETGEIGAKNSIVSDADVQKDILFKPFIDSLPNAFSTFSISAYDANTIRLNILQKVLVDNIDPQTALNQVNEKLQGELDKFWTK